MALNAVAIVTCEGELVDWLKHSTLCDNWLEGERCNYETVPVRIFSWITSGSELVLASW